MKHRFSALLDRVCVASRLRSECDKLRNCLKASLRMPQSKRASTRHRIVTYRCANLKEYEMPRSSRAFKSPRVTGEACCSIGPYPHEPNPARSLPAHSRVCRVMPHRPPHHNAYNSPRSHDLRMAYVKTKTCLRSLWQTGGRLRFWLSQLNNGVFPCVPQGSIHPRHSYDCYNG